LRPTVDVITSIALQWWNSRGQCVKYVIANKNRCITHCIIIIIVRCFYIVYSTAFRKILLLSRNRPVYTYFSPYPKTVTRILKPKYPFCSNGRPGINSEKLMRPVAPLKVFRRNLILYLYYFHGRDFPRTRNA
jgi:hypothetical protein